MYLTAEEVAEILGVSKAYAYKVIRNLNDELEIKGYVVISGKVSTKYFREKFYGFEIALQKEETE
jgi:sugar-specific transcriptional regulator TrmB